MKKFVILTDVHSLVEQIITAETGEKAIEIAKKNIDFKTFSKQIEKNMIIGKSELVFSKKI